MDDFNMDILTERLRNLSQSADFRSTVRTEPASFPHTGVASLHRSINAVNVYPNALPMDEITRSYFDNLDNMFNNFADGNSGIGTVGSGLGNNPTTNSYFETNDPFEKVQSEVTDVRQENTDLSVELKELEELNVLLYQALEFCFTVVNKDDLENKIKAHPEFGLLYE